MTVLASLNSFQDESKTALLKEAPSLRRIVVLNF